MNKIADWTYAKSAKGWDMSLFGMPKMTIVCGRCSRQSKSRAQAANQGQVVFVWCLRCGVANILRGVNVA